jgi:ribosome-binding protein aMBF1 (putative translation factor)
MPLAPVENMTQAEIYEYIESLERENRELRRKTDNSRRLDERDAQRIRTMYGSGKWKQADLADVFNVNPGTISRIVNNHYWKVAA